MFRFQLKIVSRWLDRNVRKPTGCNFFDSHCVHFKIAAARGSGASQQNAESLLLRWKFWSHFLIYRSIWNVAIYLFYLLSVTMSGEFAHGSWSHHSSCSAASDIVAAIADFHHQVDRIIIFRVDRWTSDSTDSHGCSAAVYRSQGTKVCRYNWYSAGSLVSNKIYGNNFIYLLHSETVMVWNYQNASWLQFKKINFLCHFL